MKIFFLCGSNVTESVSKEFCCSFLFYKNRTRTSIIMKHSDKIKSLYISVYTLLNLLLIKYNVIVNREVNIA